MDIIKEYESKYSRIFKCFLLNENIYRKLNRLDVTKPFLKAWQKAKYIALCKRDDYLIDPYKMQKQVEFWRKIMINMVLFTLVRLITMILIEKITKLIR